MGYEKKPIVPISMFVIVFVMSLCLESIRGEVYNVGDSFGWTNNGSVDYKAWAAAKTFRVGDTIVFEYDKQLQNVVRVSHEEFNACNDSRPIAIYNSGIDKFIIYTPGHFYFICSITGHCQSGQRVDIRVSNELTAPTPAPAPHDFSPSQSPSPAVGGKHNGVVSLPGNLSLPMMAVALAVYFSNFAY